MDLEEHTLENAGDRCEECGAQLTDQELRLILERGGPTLCTVHMTEAVPALEVDDSEAADAAI